MLSCCFPVTTRTHRLIDLLAISAGYAIRARGLHRHGPRTLVISCGARYRKPAISPPGDLILTHTSSLWKQMTRFLRRWTPATRRGHSVTLPSCVFYLAILRATYTTPQVAEPPKDDTPTQAGSPDCPIVAQDTQDPTIESLDRRSASPGVYENAYIQLSASLDATEAPLRLMESDRAYPGVSALDSPVGVQRGSELEVEFGCGFGMTPSTVTGTISQLIYVIAFSHLSHPRRASPPISPYSPGFQVHRTPLPGQTDISAPYSGASSDIDSSSVFTEPVPATFVRPVSPFPPSSPGFINDYSVSDDVTIPLFPLPSSPVPSSSPPNFFTSSPAHATYKSPPTSPTPEKPTAVFPRVGPNPLKRLRSPDTMATPAGEYDEDLGEGTTKKRVRHTRYSRTCGAHAVSRS